MEAIRNQQELNATMPQCQHSLMWMLSPSNKTQSLVGGNGSTERYFKVYFL